MKRNKAIRIVLIVLASAASLWITVAFLLPLILPFLIGLILARLARPAVRFLQEKARLPRWIASGLAVLTLFTLLGFGIYGLCRVLCGKSNRIGWVNAPGNHVGHCLVECQR